MAEATGAPRRVISRRSNLPYAGLVVGVWATVAPYVLLGPDLNAEGSVEFADHVVPGLVMIVLSGVTLLRDRRATVAGSFPLVAGFVVLLAGLWMTLTHLPLVRDARNGLVTDGVAAWHTVPGLVVLVLGVVWVAAYWSDAAEP